MRAARSIAGNPIAEGEHRQTLHQRTAGPLTAVLAFAVLFFIGYLIGIPAGRRGEETYGAALAAFRMDKQNYAAFLTVYVRFLSGMFLQTTAVMLCGFHVGGSIFLGIFFVAKGILMGLCASGVYLAQGVRGLVVHWLLSCLPDLGLLLLLLWLAGRAYLLSAGLIRCAFSGGRAGLTAPIRQLIVRYLIAVAVGAGANLVFAASAVLFAGVLL